MITITEKKIMAKWPLNYTKPEVTISCLAYNHERYIEQALDGFLSQKTNFPYEVVVHDDASTDGTAAIIREYEKKYPHIIKPIYETENQYSKFDGSITRIMDERMTGKYIALCEGDDYWTDPNKLQKQYEALENHPECVIALNRVQFIQADGIVIVGLTAPSNKAKFGEIVTLKEFCDEEYGKPRWAFHTSSYFFRTSTLMLNPILKDFPWGDMRRILNSLMIGNAYYINETMGCYRVMSGGYNSRIASNIELAIKERERFISALNRFDVLTKREYHHAIQHRIKAEEYDIYRRERNILKMLSLRYVGIIKLKRRIIDSAQILAPNLYENIKKKIKNEKVYQTD